MDFNYSVIEKNDIMPFTAEVDIGMVRLSGVSQRKTNIICYHLYVESYSKDTHKFTYKIGIDP